MPTCLQKLRNEDAFTSVSDEHCGENVEVTNVHKYNNATAALQRH